MNTFQLAPILLVMFCGVALAEDGLVGKYSGHRYGEGGGGSATELQILSVEGNKVKAILTRYGQGFNFKCGGDYPMEGTYSGNTLQLSSVKTADGIRGCGTRLVLTVNGNKLSGTIGGQGRKLELSK